MTLASPPRFPRWAWPVYLALFALSVPWWVPGNVANQLWLGLPAWVVLSLVACVAIATFTAWLVHRYWRTPRSGDDP